ncbi:MAG: cellulase family glycosylhydrolase [Anaerolineae bacterium]
MSAARDWLIRVFSLLTLVGCLPSLPNTVDVTPITPVPTVSDNALCALGQDSTQTWQTRLDALITVHDRFGSCETDIDRLLYDSYLIFARQLGSGGDAQGAVNAYERALFYLPEGQIARDELLAIENLPAVDAFEECEDGRTVDDVTLAPYQVTERAFLTFDERGFIEDGIPYPIYGTTYYPRDTPFSLFLTASELNAIEAEMALMRDAGLNTLRLLIRPQDLFACDAVVPIVENVERLDGIIQLAGTYDFRAILVLHHDIEPSVRYFAEFVQAQTAFIVTRYRDEPTIIAWDVLDQGDVDYRTGRIRQDIAMRWLAESIVRIRQLDSNHAITAGWWQDALVTAPLVDFVSFQFYGEYADLRQEIANLRANTTRPILLAGIGYSTYEISDVSQRNLLFQAFEEVTNNALMGWIVNHAFDYPRTVTCTPPDCPGSGSALNQYGLWNTGYFPKLAVEAVRLATGISE